MTAVLWPPAEYSAAATWCPHCAYPLARRDHHRHCLGYIVGTPDLALCSCPCNEPRRAAAAERKPDPLTDRPRWWQELPGWRGSA